MSCWDNTYLYVGVKVLDSILNNDSTNVWDDDSVDIYIDANHSHSTTYDASDLHLVKGYNDASLFATGGNTAGVLHNSAAVPGGYTIEMAIPWSKLGVTPTNNMTIGVDVAVNDDDRGGDRDSQSMWNNNTPTSYQDTSNFGHVVLNAANQLQ
ncbi:MAG: sugar-binding protein [Gammaproteobacteria bacterium]